MLKKVAAWIAIAVVVMWVLNSPEKAAGLIDKFTNAITTLANSLG